MAFTIDIDTGGTFTDGIVVRGQDVRTVKVPTTPHDLTVCFAECISACAQAFEISVPVLLAQTDIVRFCNTIGTNTIIQRDGSKIGLILTAGAEAGALTEAGDAPAPLVLPELVTTVAEAVDASGVATHEPDAAAVLTAAQSLIDRGARALVVAFRNSERNAVHERLVRRIIKSEYPRDYLGSVPVFLASDISTRSGYAERINAAAINAYIHAKLTRLLYKAGEDLRQKAYPHVLFIGHNNGAAARVAKTRPINTYNSGPTAGLLGARAVGGLYQLENVISTDMGGTSFDIGVVRQGRAALALEPDVEGFRCNVPMLSIRALGAGGGSIASVSKGELRVGPRSAGAYPGPACFDRGGTEATVTDANLVLGLLDPAYFLGGQQRLHVERARQAIDRHVAAPLGLRTEEAALRIKQTVDEIMGLGVKAAARGLDPKRVAIVAYGGAGPLHACAIARISGLERTLLTPFSAVFSAFSSSLMDVGHLYYRRVDVSLVAPLELDLLAKAENDMRAEAERDMRGEGFETGELRYELQAFISSGTGGREVLVPCEVGFFSRPDAVVKLRAMAESGFEDLGTRSSGTLYITSLALFANATTPHIDLTSSSAGGAKSQSRSGHRRVYTRHGWIDTPVREPGSLSPNVAVAGPLLIDTPQTTLFVEPDFSISIDEYNNLSLRRTP